MTSLRPKVKAQPRSQGAPTASTQRMAGLSEQDLIQMQQWDQDWDQEEGAAEMEMEDENQVWDPETGTWGSQFDPQEWYHRTGDYPEGYQSQEEEELSWED